MHVKCFGRFVITFEVEHDMPGYTFCSIYDRTGEEWEYLSGAYGKSELHAFRRARYNNPELRKED